MDPIVEAVAEAIWHEANRQPQTKLGAIARAAIAAHLAALEVAGVRLVTTVRKTSEPWTLEDENGPD